MNTTNTNTTKTMFGNQRRAVSPILATVLLLGITVVGGGLAYTLMSQGSTTASTQNIINVINAQATKGSGHADMTATIKNAGTVSWTSVKMTVAKSGLSEPLLYEDLDEVAIGCTGSCFTAGAKAVENAENPLRAQWIAHLDKSGGTSGVADKGEGIGVGTKFVLSTSDPEIRTVVAPAGTSVQKLLTAVDTTNNISDALEGKVISTTPVDVSSLFAALGSDKGNYYCQGTTTGSTIIESDVECKVGTQFKVDSPIKPGQSVQIYADGLTFAVPGLNNLIMQSGDALVVNIIATGQDGSDARYQTTIKVTGV